MEKFYHKYKGIIVQNDDPDKIGRVKVWVPSVNMTLYENWNADRETDKIFTKLGDNLNSSITPEILQRLKEGLPWAIVKHPIFGMGTGVTYHNDINYSEISNDSDESTQQVKTNKEIPPDKESQDNPLKQELANSLKTNPAPQVDINNYENKTTSNDLSQITNNNTFVEPPLPTIPEDDPNIGKISVEYESDPDNFQSPYISDALFPSGNKNLETSDTNFNFSAPITYEKSANVSTKTEIEFIPSSRYEQNKHRKFTTSSSFVVYDERGIVIAQENEPEKPIIIPKNKINNINIGYVDYNKPVNTNTTQIGGLSALLQEYKQPPQGTITSANSVVTPPRVINQKSYNRGGGGSELFTGAFSNLLPLQGTTESLVGAVNPDSKIGINHGRNQSGIVDPNERVGSNIQTKADSNPVMRPPTQNNKVKGMISIPAVGSIVSVYFDNGDPLYPIVDGVFYTQEDHMGIHDVS